MAGLAAGEPSDRFEDDEEISRNGLFRSAAAAGLTRGDARGDARDAADFFEGVRLVGRRLLVSRSGASK